MTPLEVRDHLQLLGLSPAQAAWLLGVGLRTMRRWTDLGDADDEAQEAAPAGQGTDIPGPAEQALRSWLKLHRLGLSWRPGAAPLSSVGLTGGAGSALEEARLASMLEWARERGNKQAPLWDVDIGRGHARLGAHRVSFSRSGGHVAGFVLQSYWREEAEAAAARRAPDVDATNLEDACACIARRLAGERDPPRLRLALEMPQLGPDGCIEMWDRSLGIPVVVRIGAEAWAAAWSDNSGTTAAVSAGPTERVLREARSARPAIAALAEQLIAQGEFQARGLPGCRIIELKASELGTVASLMQAMRAPAAGASRRAAAAAPAP